MNIIKSIALKLISIYRYFSKFTPSVCIYEPTCSQYTYTAIERFGLFKGIYLGIKRILRCNPWHEGGYDPVPEEFKWRYKK